MPSSFARLSRAVALVALVTVGGCESATAVSTPESGAFVGRWAGQPWTADATALLILGAPGGDLLYVFGTTPRGAGIFGVEETLTARVRFTGPGLYELTADDVGFAELEGGDVVAAHYRGVGEPAGFLRVTRYDPAARVVEGELRFRAATSGAAGSYGTSARFEDGRFAAPLATDVSHLRIAAP